MLHIPETKKKLSTLGNSHPNKMKICLLMRDDVLIVFDNGVMVFSAKLPF